MRTIHSPFGQVLKGIKENEPRALSLGYDVSRFKLLAFVISAALSGLAGSLKTLVLGFATLSDVHWTASGQVILMTLVGGLGTLSGPLVGSAVVVLLENKIGELGNLLARITTIDWFNTLGESVTMVTGLIFVICVLAFRQAGSWARSLRSSSGDEPNSKQGNCNEKRSLGSLFFIASAVAFFRLAGRAEIAAVAIVVMAAPIVAIVVAAAMLFFPFAFTARFTVRLAPAPVAFGPAPAAAVLDPAARGIGVARALGLPAARTPSVGTAVPGPAARHPDEAAARRWQGFVAWRRRRRHHQPGHIDVHRDLRVGGKGARKDGKGAGHGQHSKSNLHDGDPLVFR